MLVCAQKSGLYETEGHHVAKTSLSHRHTWSVWDLTSARFLRWSTKKSKKKKRKKKTKQGFGGVGGGGGSQSVAVWEEAANTELKVCLGWNVMISKRGKKRRAWGSTFHLPASIFFLLLQKTERITISIPRKLIMQQYMEKSNWKKIVATWTCWKYFIYFLHF